MEGIHRTHAHPARIVLGLALFGLIFAFGLLAGCGGTTSDVADAGATTTGPSQDTDPTAPAEAAAPAGGASGRLVIYSARNEPLVQPVLDAFVARNPDVEIALKTGKNGELANALAEERANPQADLFITTELLTVQSLAADGVFAPYRSPAAEAIPAELRGPDDLWTGLTSRARVIMYNTELVTPDEAPTSIFDLVDPKWKGQVAAADSTNGSMQAQVAALRVLLGEGPTLEWLEGLLANEVTFFGGHTDVRKAVGAGEFKIGLVNHYYYYLQQAEGSPVGIVFPDQGEAEIGLLTNATAAAVIAGSANPTAAQAFIDFLLSPEGQKLFAEANYEYPLLAGVALHPDVQPLDGLRPADVDVAAAALDLDATFTLIEKSGMQ
ncbi:MAG: extracellular solute-binding protein [Thermoleophilia bacterium]